MKIIDENGVELTGEPDMTLGRLVDDVEIVHHEATPAVEKVSHWVTTRTYPNGSRDVEEVVDVEPVAARDAWDETVPIQRLSSTRRMNWTSRPGSGSTKPRWRSCRKRWLQCKRKTRC